MFCGEKKRRILPSSISILIGSTSVNFRLNGIHFFKTPEKISFKISILELIFSFFFRTVNDSVYFQCFPI